MEGGSEGDGSEELMQMRGWRGDADESGDSERMDERLSGWKKERERGRELVREANKRRVESGCRLGVW